MNKNCLKQPVGRPEFIISMFFTRQLLCPALVHTMSKSVCRNCSMSCGSTGLVEASSVNSFHCAVCNINNLFLKFLQQNQEDINKWN